MRITVVCICFSLIQLALSQQSQSCTKSSKCDYHNLLNFTNIPENLLNDKYRILIYYHHFQKLNKKEKKCLLKEIFRFYKRVYINVSTTKIPAHTIYSLNDNLHQLNEHCLKSRHCNKLIKKEEVKEKYRKNMNLNSTTIISYQLNLLNKARRKLKRSRAEIQEKVIGELSILQQFLTS